MFSQLFLNNTAELHIFLTCKYIILGLYFLKIMQWNYIFVLIDQVNFQYSVSGCQFIQNTLINAFKIMKGGWRRKCISSPLDIKHYAFSRFSLALSSSWVSGSKGECVLGQIRNTLKASLQPCKSSNYSRLVLTKVKIQQTKG